MNYRSYFLTYVRTCYSLYSLDLIIISCVCPCFFSSLLFGSVASSLRTPMAVPCPYPTPFGIVPHAGMNGELTSPGAAYAGLHNISPQMSAAAAAAAAAAAYGRSPVVCCKLLQNESISELRKWPCVCLPRVVFIA